MLSDEQVKQRINDVGSVEDAMQHGLRPEHISDPITRIFWREAYENWVNYTNSRNQVIEHLASTVKESVEFKPISGYGQ